MKDGWQTYETEVDGLLCSINAHLALREHAPDPHLGICYVIRVGLLAPSPNGLVEREEQPALDAIERELDDGLAGMSGAAFAGHITGGGTRDYFFYGPMAELLDPVLAQMQVDFPHYTIVGGAEPDPNWEQFLYTICPAEPAASAAEPEPPAEPAESAVPAGLPDVPISDDFETVELPPTSAPAPAPQPKPVTEIAAPSPPPRPATEPLPPMRPVVQVAPLPPRPVTEIAPPAPARSAADPLVEAVQSKIDKRLEQLLAAGDLPERERPVSHWIAFRDEELRRDFLTQVNHGEFEQETLETNDDGAMKWWARLEKSQTTDAPAVRATVARLVKIAANYGGEYDALETCVSKRV